MKKTKFIIKEVVNVVNGRTEERLCMYNGHGRIVIVLRLWEVDEIINFFYVTYRKEGSKKLFARIDGSYAGISRDIITTWINANYAHGVSNPVFQNEVPLQLVVSHTVNSRHQVDLVSFENLPVEKDGVIYNFVLSVLDVFSRYFWLRPLKSKEPSEVLLHLKEIYS